MNLTHALTWAQSHATALMTVAGAALIALVIVAVLLAARKASLASVLRGIAIPLVLLWEAQGVYGVALRLHAPRELAWAFAGVTSAVVLALASFAHKHYERHGTLGPNGRMMWLVAVPMGAVVAANAGSLTGAGLRVLLPLLSLVMFRAPYLPDEPAGQQAKTGSWRLTPRRLGVSLGLLDPADTDLTTVHAERTIRLLTRHAAGYHRGARSLRRWHGHRFERLALAADDDMIAEAALRVRRVHTGLASTAPEPSWDHPEVVPEAVPEIVPESSQPDPRDDSRDHPEDRLQGRPATGLRDRPVVRSEDRPEPSLKLAASKSSKMSSNDLAPHVAAMLKAHGDKAVTIARVKTDLHVGADKAKEALLIAKRDRVTPIGLRRSAGE